jgi:hypothetical protein
MPRDRSVAGRVRALIKNDPTGLMSGFIDQAIEYFVQDVAQADPAGFTRRTNSFVNGEAWVARARAVLADCAATDATFLDDNPAALRLWVIVPQPAGPDTG